MRSVLKIAALGVLMAMLAGCDLAITKTADPDPAFVGKRLAYTIEVTNLETTNPPSEYGQTVANATVLDRLPETVEFVSANPSQGECAPADAENRVLCNLGALEGEQSETVRIVVTPTEAGKIRNTAETQACFPGDMAGIDEENGELTCMQTENSPFPEQGTANDVEDLSEEQLTTLRGTSGIVGPPSEGTCGFNESSPCDPQENNTVTITTTVRDAPAANACTITGTPGNDILDGTPGRDVICGLGGNDIIRGAGGNDVLRGGIGNDVIYGEVGDDTILGEAGNDTVRGGDGNDRIEGAEGKDALYGERGNDTILGGIGNDVLRGGPGQDSLNGGPGKNSVKQ